MAFTSDILLSDALETIIRTIESATTLTRGPQIIDARTNPSPALDGKYSLNLSSTRNPGRYRDSDRIALNHTLVISFCKQMKMQDQYASLLEVLDTEYQLISAPGENQVYGPIRWEYQSTTRSLTASREYLIVSMTFQFTHDLARA